jgi:UPF0755 protein
MATLARLLAIVVAFAACGTAAVLVYAALGHASPLGRLLPADWDSPVSSTPERISLTVRPGESAAAVGDDLQQHGLIRSALMFRWEVESSGLGGKLGAGEYELSPSMSTREIVAVLVRGAVSHGTRITVLEGWRAEQVAQRLEELQLAQADQILRLVKTPREQGLQPADAAADSLEGYLFPETYELDPKATPVQMVATMLREFDRRFDDGLRRQAASHGMSVNQAVTLASIIEREAAKPSERALISSVYHNRLAAGMKLAADPTVQYAVANLDLKSALGYGFWKRELTADDLKIDSPYNTYLVTGLPPGPVCSPGLESLQAAVNPSDSTYLFFVARGDGTHAFAETPQEHQANVQRFR